MNEKGDAYILDCMGIICTDGMKLLSECLPEAAYRVVTKYDTDDPTLNLFKTELESYLLTTDTAIPRKKIAWYKRLFAWI